jgi:hypothetical protein
MLTTIDIVVQAFATADKVSALERRAREPEAALVLGNALRDMQFKDTFEVESVRYRTAGGETANASLRRLPGLSDRLLPVPEVAHVSASGALLDSPDLSVDKGRFQLSKTWDSIPAHASLAAGRLSDSMANRRFIAIGAPDAQEFSLHLTASLTTSAGTMCLFFFAGDGGIFPAGFGGDGFVAGLDGSLFEIAPVGGSGMRIRGRFGDLTRVRFSHRGDLTKIDLSGSLSLEQTPKPCLVQVNIGTDVLSVGVIDTTSGLTLFEGSCPIERASVAILGTQQQDKASGTGSIGLFDRDTREELRRFPISGRITGLAWDGRHLWQALWPSGDLLKIDPSMEDGAPQLLQGWNDGMVAGLVVGDEVVMGVCKANILDAAGGTTLSFVDRVTGEERHRCERPHAVSSGMSAFEGALVGAINGVDLTPFSADSGLVIMNKATGQIEETIILPRNFFIEDVTSDEEGIVLVSVTEGVSAIGARGSIYELRRMA